MAKTFSKPLKEFITSDWKEMAVYKLTPKQKKQLLESTDVFKQRGMLPSGFDFEAHAHGIPQLILVEKGFLTHFAKGKAFPQKPGELLVVPANLEHTAKIGEKEELQFWVFHKVPKK